LTPRFARRARKRLQLPTEQIICIGASSGGIEALRTLVAGLRADFGAPIIVVLHTAPDSPGILGNILDRAGALPAATAVDGERIQPGRIYVAPSDSHAGGGRKFAGGGKTRGK
jgi:chemotaxis response regulator CheB